MQLHLYEASESQLSVDHGRPISPYHGSALDDPDVLRILLVLGCLRVQLDLELICKASGFIGSLGLLLSLLLGPSFAFSSLDSNGG